LVALSRLQTGLSFPCPDSLPTDPYQVLGVNPQASHGEIKAAYRALVKRHHPDAGGDAAAMLAVNAAWEVLGDRQQRHRLDRLRRDPQRGPAAPPGRSASNAATKAAAASDEEVALWLQKVYGPVDRLLGQVVNPFPAQLRALAADPYDDSLMEAFCGFLEQSQTRLARAETLYRSLPSPPGAQDLSLDLYHTLSQVKDALLDLERFTMGYVDSYLRDGRELLRLARSRRSQLQQRCRQLRA
jgi:molecular chaperone DnaJ